jgi:hypothetical protein
MLLMTGTSDLIRAVVTGPATVDFHASWVDNAAGTITPGRTNTAVSSAATYTLIAGPGASTQRNAQTITGANRSALSNATITIQHYDGSTSIDIIPAFVLASGEHFEWLDGSGFKLFDSGGQQKVLFTVPGRLLRTTFLTSGSSHTTHREARFLFAQIQAGGGGGGATTTGATNSAAGGGGSSGGYAEKAFNVTGNTAYTYAIGAGGASAAVGSNSTFAVAGLTVTALGGTAGASQTVAAPPLVSLGGATPAVSTNGDANGAGECGEGGNCEAAAIAISGRGGSSKFGGGGNSRTSQGAGTAAIAFGSGGGGGCTLSGGASTAGGAGTAGVIIVDEYA